VEYSVSFDFRSGSFATGPRQQQVRLCPLWTESGGKFRAFVTPQPVYARNKVTILSATIVENSTRDDLHAIEQYHPGIFFIDLLKS
jgi:hypothetical protein